jgi:hypothetical protein
MKKILWMAVPALLAQSSCMRFSPNLNYTRNYSPKNIEQKKNFCDYEYSVQTKRGNVHFVYNGLRMTPNYGSKSHMVRLTNHGVEFGVTTHKRIFSDNPWIIVGTGKTVEIELDAQDYGFQASNEYQIPGGRKIPEPINATIVFVGISCSLDSPLLIESYGDGL